MDEQPAEADKVATPRKVRAAGAAGKPATVTGARRGPKPGAKAARDAVRAEANALRDEASGVLSKASGVAYEAADTVFHAASDRAHDLTRQVAGILDNRVASGADMIAQVASSTRLAADDLDGKVPQVAGVVRTVADRIDSYADSMRHQTVEEMLDTASGFTRRQPAVVFGLAALAGFVLLRAFRSAPPRRSGRARNDG